VVTALEDADVIEVMLNPDGQLWVETHSRGVEAIGVTIGRIEAESLLGTVASLLGTVVNESRPLLEGELPDGSRFQGLLPPVSSAPIFVIRKRATRIYSLVDYVESGMMDPSQWSAIKEAISERRNIVIAGGTGSGKTTLANAILREMVVLGHPAERFVILEDTVELQCAAENSVQLHTGENADLTRLVRTTMRLRPDRIIIGEVRGAEALALLKAWNTGHPGGLTTVHANSAHGALQRLEQLVEEAGVIPQPEIIADAVGLLVFMERAAGIGRRVTQVARVVRWKPDAGYQLAPIRTPQGGGSHDEGSEETVRH
jgi:type IV secretion system protein TrbB